jgi:hypothetical protein
MDVPPASCLRAGGEIVLARAYAPVAGRPRLLVAGTAVALFAVLIAFLAALSIDGGEVDGDGHARVSRRFSCARVSALRLHRFEDGSAQLRCEGRLLARISSPG